MNHSFLQRVLWLLILLLTAFSPQVWGDHTLIKASDMVSGDKYIITAVYNNTTYYFIPGQYSEGAANSAGSYTTNLTDAAAWTFTKSGSNWTISTKVGNTTYYLGHNSKNNGVRTATASQNYTIAEYSTGSNTVKLTANSRVLSLYQGSNWRCYNSSSGVQNITLYKYTAASGYSITYHCNGATSGCPSNASSQTALPNPLPTPTRTGCTSAGWYTNEGLTSEATAGATLSANADLYAKWTTNVTLNRNGATETINNVVVGTDLDDIDGSGAQGGCSAWTFVGWSKTQRAVQNNSIAMDLVTTVDGSGPYYAVYSHTESGGGGTSEETASVTMSEYATANSWGSSSSEGQKSITINSDITAEISSGTNSGKYYSDGIRLYQTENATITISTSSGELTSVKFTFTVSSTGALYYNESALTSGTAVDVSGTSAVFSVGNSGSATNGQVRFTAIEVEYEVTGGSTTYYSTTASCCTPLGQINGSNRLTHRN